MASKDGAEAKIVKLTRAIGEKGDVDRLEIREPTFKDLRTHGLPISANGEVDFAKARALLANLSNQMPTTLGMMTAADTMKAIGVMSEYFGGVDEEEAKN